MKSSLKWWVIIRSRKQFQEIPLLFNYQGYFWIGTFEPPLIFLLLQNVQVEKFFIHFNVGVEISNVRKADGETVFLSFNELLQECLLITTKGEIFFTWDILEAIKSTTFAIKHDRFFRNTKGENLLQFPTATFQKFWRFMKTPCLSLQILQT